MTGDWVQGAGFREERGGFFGWELRGERATRVVPDSQRGPSICIVANADPLGFRHGGPRWVL